MNKDINKMIAGEVIAMNKVVHGKTQICNRPGPQRAVGYNPLQLTETAGCNLKGVVVCYVRLIIKNKRRT